MSTISNKLNIISEGKLAKVRDLCLLTEVPQIPTVVLSSWLEPRDRPWRGQKSITSRDQTGCQGATCKLHLEDQVGTD